jgi:hypothetical protein
MKLRLRLLSFAFAVSACSSASTESVSDGGLSESRADDRVEPQESGDGASRNDASSGIETSVEASPDGSAIACIPEPNAELSLGTVTAGSTKCDNGAAPGAACMSVAVTCYASSEPTALTGQVAISLPSGAPKGTITTHNGGAGTAYDGVMAPADFASAYTAAGYRFVQIKWDSSWQVGELGNTHSACYVATLYDWIFKNIHKSDRSAGFCGQGTSGGSASLAYSMTQYNLDTEFDYTMLVAGPAVTRLDLGCDISSWNGKQPSPAMCPSSLPAVVFPLPESAINGMEDTKTCDCSPQPSCVASSDLTKWIDDSVVTSTAKYSYPNTGVSFFMCGNWPAKENEGGVETRDAGVTNGSTLGAYYYAALTGSGVTQTAAHCFGGPGGPNSSCQGEDIFNDTNAFNDAVTTMTSECTPRHKGCDP